jgi:hypothetical protein
VNDCARGALPARLAAWKNEQYRGDQQRQQDSADTE